MKIMKINKYLIVLIFCTYINIQWTNAQNNTIKKELNIHEFLHLVSTNNIQYAAEKLNIDISDAELSVSRIFPDPSLAVDYTDNKENGEYMGHVLSYELSTTLELGGKRRARINIAKSNKEFTNAILNDYFRNLKAEASIAYMEAIKMKQLYIVSKDSYINMKKLSEADSIQYSLGNITKIDALQSKLETRILYNELLKTKVEYDNALSELSLLIGSSNEIIYPSDKLEKVIRVLNKEGLVNNALNNRADLEAIRQSRNMSNNQLKLAKREQLFDMDIKLALEDSYTKGVSKPTSKALTAGISIPLMFSNLNRGKIRAAKYKLEQNELLYKQTELNIRIEVEKSLARYNTSCKQISQYEAGLLENAKAVLNGKIYSYKRGETSLLEVLNAQRTHNDIRSAYYEAIFENITAFIELEKTIGI